MSLHEIARALRTDLSYPRTLCALSASAFGLRTGSASPWPYDPLPAPSRRLVFGHRAEHGGVRVRCFGCGFTADTLGLIAETHGLDARRDFVRVLAAAAQIAHRWDLVAALQPMRQSTASTGAFLPRRSAASTSRPNEALASYPPTMELAALWRACQPCAVDSEVAALLERRGIAPEWVDDFHLARALPVTPRLPRWASLRGARPNRVSWIDSGHRLLLPVYDPRGRMRSVRAWCVRDTADPKRLPPAGYASRHLVLACGLGVAGRGRWAGSRARRSRRYRRGRA